jgi:hypothetical protein
MNSTSALQERLRLSTVQKKKISERRQAGHCCRQKEVWAIFSSIPILARLRNHSSSVGNRVAKSDAVGHQKDAAYPSWN